MSDHMIDVMVSATGAHIIDDGDVHDPDKEETYFLQCWCPDRKHKGVEAMTPGMFPGRTPHIVGVTKYTLYWEVRNDRALPLT